jgi:hypothetical protein
VYMYTRINFFFETCALTWRQHLYKRIVDMYTRIHVRVYVYAYFFFLRRVR